MRCPGWLGPLPWRRPEAGSAISVLQEPTAKRRRRSSAVQLLQRAWAPGLRRSSDCLPGACEGHCVWSKNKGGFHMRSAPARQGAAQAWAGDSSRGPTDPRGLGFPLAPRQAMLPSPGLAQGGEQGGRRVPPVRDVAKRVSMTQSSSHGEPSSPCVRKAGVGPGSSACSRATQPSLF